MRIQKWETIYWTGALFVLCGYYMRDFALILGGLLIILLGTVKGMTRQ
jgi:hypothetical protein